MRSTDALIYRPVYGESLRLKRDILGDVSLSRDAGLLRRLFEELSGFLQKTREKFTARPRLIERRLGQHSLYLWREDLAEIWEGRKGL